MKDSLALSYNFSFSHSYNVICGVSELKLPVQTEREDDELRAGGAAAGKRKRAKRRMKPEGLPDERAEKLDKRSHWLVGVPDKELLPSFLLWVFSQGVFTHSTSGGLSQDQAAALLSGSCQGAVAECKNLAEATEVLSTWAVRGPWSL